MRLIWCAGGRVEIVVRFGAKDMSTSKDIARQRVNSYFLLWRKVTGRGDVYENFKSKTIGRSHLNELSPRFGFQNQRTFLILVLNDKFLRFDW